MVDSKKEEYAYENKCNKIKTYFPLSIENGFLVEQSVNKMKILPGFDLDSFNIRRLSGAETITLYEGMEQWSGTQMTWSSRKEPGDIISHNEHLNSGWEGLDISDYVKKCFTYG